MTEAEKKWEEWAAGKSALAGRLNCIIGIKAYKEALRSAIEEKIKNVPKGFTYPMSAQELLSLLDQVTPK